MKSAAKVGLLLIVFVGLILGCFAFLGKTLFARKHSTYFVDLPDAGGLVDGTKVLMAGVQIGTVQRVALLNPHEARLTLSVGQKTQLPVGCRAVIPGSLVGFGESNLNIVSPNSFSGYLPDNSTIEGTKAGPLDSILPDGGKSIVGNIDKSLDAVRKLLQDQGLQTELKKLLATANQTLVASQTSLGKFNALSDRTTNLIAGNQGNVQGILASMKGTLEQVHYTAGALAQFVKEGKIQSGTTGLLTKANLIETQADSLLVKLNKIAGDPAIQHDLEASAHNVSATTEKGPKIADNVDKATANLVEITEKSKKLPDTLNEVAVKASKLEDNISSLVDKFNGVKAPSAAGLKDLRTELDLTREASPGYWRTDVNLTYPLKQGYVTFGVYDAFESNKLNLQLARSFGKSLDLRYGIYGSKAAVGVDYAITRKLSVRTDLWNINSLEFDARLRYDFGGGFIGWAGVDRAFQRSASPIIGIGVRE